MTKESRVLASRYELQNPLGAGEQTTTYLAFDRERRRPCVVKELLLQRVESAKVVELFEREARVLRNLHHPQIPEFIDYFTIEEPGRVAIYLVQDHVRGQNLAELVGAGRRFTEREVVDIAIGVATVLDHLQGLSPPIWHRDIKPSNVLLTDDGRVFLVDFGAVREKIQDDEAPYGGGRTVTGTFGYMPLEQFEGRAVASSDIYSLGATLIFLLSQHEPWTLERRGMRLAFENVVRTSPALTQVIRRMVEPDWRDRYPSPDALLGDLRAVAAGRKLARSDVPGRRRWLTIAAAAAVLVGGLLFLLFERTPVPVASPDVAEETAPPGEGPANHGPRWGGVPAGPAQTRSCMPETLAPGNVPPPKSYPADKDTELPAGAVARLGNPRLRHPVRCMTVAISPDGQLLGTADAVMSISIWQLSTGRELHRLHGHCHHVAQVVFSADGRSLISASLDHSVRRWDVDRGVQVEAVELADAVTSLSLAPDHRTLVAGSRDGRIHLLDATTLKRFKIFEPAGGEVSSAALAPDGALAAATVGERLRLFKVMLGKEAPELAPDDKHPMATWVRFLDDRRLLVGGLELRIWNVETRTYERKVPIDPVSGDAHFALAPGAKVVAVGGVADTVQIVDMDSGKLLRRLSAGEWYIEQLSFSPDEQRLAVAGWDGKARIWDWRSGEQLLDDGQPAGRFYHLAFSRSGRELTSIQLVTNRAHRWDVAGRRYLGGAATGLHLVQFMVLRDGSQGATWGVTLSDAEIARFRQFLDRVGYRIPLSNIVRTPGDGLWAIAAERGELRFLDLEDGRERLRLARQERPATDPGDLPNSGVNTGVGVLLRIWIEEKTSTFRELATSRPGYNMVVAAAMSPGGRRLALAEETGSVAIWDVRKKKLLATIPVRTSQLAFSPDGETLALLGATLQLRDATSGELRTTITPGHRGVVTAFAYSQDGSRMATAGSEGTILLWDL